MARKGKAAGSAIGSSLSQEEPGGSAETSRRVLQEAARKVTYDLPPSVIEHLGRLYHQLRPDGFRRVKEHELVIHALRGLDENELRKIFAAG